VRPPPALSRFRVPAAWALFALVAVLARPSTATALIALPLALAGEALRLWAAGHIEKGRELATGGPYAHTRNPLYLGSALMAAGLAVATRSAAAAVLIAAYLAVFYPLAVSSEAALLRARFGEAYDRWASEVPALLPRLTPAGARASRFEWRRVLANREWRAAAALPAVAALLAARRWMG
jgi:protein-S-isoprenylcysteine O-methyltransferase Ste14